MAGIENPNRNYLADSARQAYGEYESAGNMVLHPRSKFLFTWILEWRPLPDRLDSTTWKSFPRIANISLPSFTVKTETLSEYNIKRNIQTGVDFNEVTVEAYDTHDAQIETFLKAYMNYYYHDVMQDINKDRLQYDRYVGADFPTAAGYKLPLNKYCISKFIVERKQGKNINIIELINPMITRVEHDTLDYSSSDLVKYRITFSYETYRITSGESKPHPAPKTKLAPEPPKKEPIIIPEFSAQLVGGTAGSETQLALLDRQEQERAEAGQPPPTRAEKQKYIEDNTTEVYVAGGAKATEIYTGD